MPHEDCITKLKEASDKLAALMVDPQPGLWSWTNQLGKVLLDIERCKRALQLV